MANIAFLPGNFQPGEENLCVIVGNSRYNVKTSKIETSSEGFWHLTLHATGNAGPLDGSYFHFFFFENGTLKGVALPTDYCIPAMAVTMSGKWLNKFEVKSHPPLVSNAPGFLCDEVRIERH